MSREQEDIENIHESELANQELPAREFNTKFNLLFEQQGRKMMKGNQLIVQEKPDFWNNDTHSNFVTLDSTDLLYEEYEDTDSGLFNNKAGSLGYASINAVGYLPTMEVSKVKNSQKSYEDLLKEREIETKNIENMSMGDFNIESKDFQFLHEIGYDEFCAAKEKIAHSGPVLAITQDKELHDKYEKLLEQRRLLLKKGTNGEISI